ncbi:MAG: T9SS type A sorting domain-containing protein, partial [Bacteroidota bacterium]
IQPDGKIVAAGFGWQSWERAVVMRFNSDGSIDNSFSGDGIAIIEIGGFSDRLWDIELQDDGKIVGCGTCFVSGSDSDWCSLRLNPDGTLDSSYGQGGFFTLDLGATQVSAEALKIMDDGRILMAGYAVPDGTYLMQFAMFNSNGTLDESWDNDGLVEVIISNADDAVKSLAIQEDGKILAAGYGWNGFNYDFALTRLNPDGSLDLTFDGDGKELTSIGEANDFIESIYLRSNGDIIAGGTSFTNENGFEFALAMYNSDGSLKEEFGEGGKVISNLSDGADIIFGMEAAPDGNILAAGTIDPSPVGEENFELALVKYIDQFDLSTNLSTEQKLKIFPNPNQGIFQLKIEGFASVVSSLQIFDLTGRLVWQKRVPTNGEITSINLGNIPSGVYLLSSKTGEKVVKKRIVIE